jgi:hypothetical protein
MHDRAVKPYKEILLYRMAQRKYGKLNRYKLSIKPRYGTIKEPD